MFVSMYKWLKETGFTRRLHLVAGGELRVEGVAETAPCHRAEDDEVVRDGLGRVAVGVAHISAPAGAVVDEIGAGVVALRKKTPLLSAFPCACPEPVLVKRSF